MKKAIAILLALIMAFGMAQSAPADATALTPSAMSLLDYPAAKWLSCESNRCCLTIFAMTDWKSAANTNNRYSFNGADPSYVADMGEGELLIYFSVTDSYTKNNDYVTVFFTPSDKSARYEHSDNVSPAAAGAVMAALGKTYYENDVSTLRSCVEYIKAALGS